MTVESCCLPHSRIAAHRAHRRQLTNNGEDHRKRKRPTDLWEIR